MHVGATDPDKGNYMKTILQGKTAVGASDDERYPLVQFGWSGKLVVTQAETSSKEYNVVSKRQFEPNEDYKITIEVVNSVITLYVDDEKDSDSGSEGDSTYMPENIVITNTESGKVAQDITLSDT